VSARRKARKRALDVLFSADVRGVELTVALDEAEIIASRQPERSSSWGYAKEMVEGVLAHRGEIDQLLSDTSESWPLERMPTVDRAVLRIGVWEILYNPNVPLAVVISEAVELASELSTEASGGFVHGILSAIAEHTSPAEVQPKQ
jgi:N utilization substance protein B